MAQAPKEDEEEDPFFPNFRLMAEGGRVGLQEGGGIEQRLEKLGGDVSSAEQMLQGINQRLKTAESSLGSGGGGLGGLQQPGIIPGGVKLPEISGEIPFEFDNNRPGPNSIFGGRPIAEVNNIRTLGQPMLNGVRQKSFDEMNPAEKLRAAQTRNMQQDVKPVELQNYLNEVIRTKGETDMLYPNLPDRTSALPLSGSIQNLQNQQDVVDLEQLYPNAGQNKISNFRPLRGGAEMMGLAGIPAAGYADGGNVVGGEYDFESARQMYGLGKLVKKITRSVKKIAKSPIGKAAIGAALFQFGKPLVKSEAFKNFFLKDAAKGFSLANLSTRGALTGIAGISALGGLTAEEDDEEQLYVGADFPNPVDFYLSGQAPMNTRLAAEGGLMRAGYQEGSKEPVAKKTMPLLDMGGMEKDYREEGGFVPIGRMEKADDVPARLSKNEFVFTADAVRNAGDGDVDLGAEKMYNMMKNLEAGGDVSEESQGLKGAREMFQTSQRLGEVI